MCLVLYAKRLTMQMDPMIMVVESIETVLCDTIKQDIT